MSREPIALLTISATESGGVPGNYIAKWDGEAWYPVGGGFTSVDGADANGIARWKGNQSSALGDETSNWVWAMEIFDDGSSKGPALYVGGSLQTSPAGDSKLARWQGCPVEPECGLADLNCDGVVNGLDLLILLENWGACDAAGPPGRNPEDCPADLNGDGLVNVLDLLLLLENWG